MAGRYLRIPQALGPPMIYTLSKKLDHYPYSKIQVSHALKYLLLTQPAVSLNSNFETLE